MEDTWNLLVLQEGEGGVHCEEEHGGHLHEGQEGRQLNQILLHIKVSVENSLYDVFMDT